MERFSRATPGIFVALALTLVCGFVRPANASVVYVNANSTSPTPDGKTWATAFTAIRPAIDASSPGDEMWVAGGLYVETVIGPKPNAPIYGGFAGTEIARDQRDWKAHPSIVKGVAICYPTAAGSQFILDGFRFIGGDIFHPTKLSVENGAEATITNCEFNLPVSDRFVIRGISILDGSARISNCTFDGGNGELQNGANGGLQFGVEVGNAGAATVTNSVFTNCQYAIGVQGGTLNAFNDVFCGNELGVEVITGSAAVVNCTLTENVFSAIYVAAEAHVTNCIVAYNGTGIYEQKPNNLVTLSHSDVYGNTTANFTNLADPTGTNGNISVDPKLANKNYNLHIQPDSPCVDAGDDSAVQDGWTDIDGQARIIGRHVDIGADESDGTTWPDATRVWHVSVAGNDAADGLTWSTAKKTIGAAFAAAKGVGEVWVAKGTYTENLTLPADVALYGGFSGAETTRSQRNWTTSVAVLDGAGQDGVTSSFPGAVMDGFAVRNGKNGVNVLSGDAAISNCTFSGNSNSGISSAAPIVVSNCTVRGNYYGIYARGSSTTIDASVITGNPRAGLDLVGALGAVSDSTLSGNGYGIVADGGAMTVTHCAFIGNGNAGFSGNSTLDMSNCTVRGSFDSVYTTGTRTTITNCSLSGSTQYAVFMWNGDLSVNNCTLTGNSHAIYVGLVKAVSITNCVVAFNDGFGVFMPDGGTVVPAFSHNDVFSNREGDWINFHPSASQGNISADPLFVNRFDGDYHLRLRSPCIDTGDDSVVTPGETDLDGRPRIQRSHVDTGCYEFPGAVKYVPTKAAGGVFGG